MSIHPGLQYQRESPALRGLHLIFSWLFTHAEGAAACQKARCKSREYAYASRTSQVLRGLPAVAWILLPEMGLHVLIVLHGVGIEGSLQQVQLSPVQGFLHDITGSSASNQTLIRAYYISQSISSYACKPSSPLSSHATPLAAGLPDESPIRQPQDTAMQRAMGCCNEDRFSRVAFKAGGDPRQSARQLKR